jgi:hypothetical protein
VEDLPVGIGYQLRLVISLQLIVLFAVTSMDAQTWAAPQTAHYLRGDKFEEPMGEIAQARNESNYPAIQAEIHDRRASRVQLRERLLGLGVCAGSNIETKNGLCF